MKENLVPHGLMESENETFLDRLGNLFSHFFSHS